MTVKSSPCPQIYLWVKMKGVLYLSMVLLAETTLFPWFKLSHLRQKIGNWWRTAPALLSEEFFISRGRLELFQSQICPFIQSLICCFTLQNGATIRLFVYKCKLLTCKQYGRNRILQGRNSLKPLDSHVIITFHEE